MGMITSSDGRRLFSKDWGSGQPVILSHGWPSTADAWDDQLLLAASNGYRAIAHDRRGHGRARHPGPAMPWTLRRRPGPPPRPLELHKVVLVGPSTSGGEVTRYLGRRHGTTPWPRPCWSGRSAADAPDPSQPQGTPIQAFDAIGHGLASDPSQFDQAGAPPSMGQPAPNQPLAGVGDSFWLWNMPVGLKGAYACVTASSETDPTQDPERIDVAWANWPRSSRTPSARPACRRPPGTCACAGPRRTGRSGARP